MRRGDEKTTAAQIAYKLEESTEAVVREARCKAKYEQTAQQLSAELSMQAAQNLQYLEAKQRVYAQLQQIQRFLMRSETRYPQESSSLLIFAPMTP